MQQAPNSPNIRIIDATTGELLRELVLNPTKRYQRTGRLEPESPRMRATSSPLTRPALVEL
jgi:hypothetical protein